MHVKMYFAACLFLRDSYLKDLEGDSNVLFAVMYQGKLLSTNLEGLTAQKAEKRKYAGFCLVSSGRGILQFYPLL